MSLLSLPAVFMRGGTSRAVMFHARDLPDRGEWDPIFLTAMGSPDPNGRQLNGMGGGISSLSKVCVLAPLRGTPPSAKAIACSWVTPSTTPPAKRPTRSC